MKHSLFILYSNLVCSQEIVIAVILISIHPKTLQVAIFAKFHLLAINKHACDTATISVRTFETYSIVDFVELIGPETMFKVFKPTFKKV